MVDVLEVSAEGEVLERRRLRLWRSSSSTRRKGRYLLPLAVDEEGCLRFSLMVVSDEGPFNLSLLADSERLLSLSWRSPAPGRFAWFLSDAERGSFCSVGEGYSHCALSQWEAITATLLV